MDARDRQVAIDNPILRRFSSEQELTDWLKKDMRRDRVEVEDVMRRFDGEDRVEISDLQYGQEELRQFKLAA